MCSAFGREIDESDLNPPERENKNVRAKLKCIRIIKRYDGKLKGSVTR